MTIFKTIMNHSKSEVDKQQSLIDGLPCLVSTTIKTEKTEKAFPNWINALTYLLPNKILCPFSEQCFEGCLKGSGRLRMNKKAMVKRTKLFFQDFPLFLHLLLKELVKVHNKAKRKGKYFAYRPNGTSDNDKIVKALLALPYTERPFDCLYDYTKVFNRVISYRDNPDYHLTFSFDGTNQDNASYLLENSISNVSVVFNVKRGEPLPKTFTFNNKSYPVKDGDLDDMRIFDKPQTIIGLRAKGSANKQDTEFVQQVNTEKLWKETRVSLEELEQRNQQGYMEVLIANNS